MKIEAGQLWLPMRPKEPKLARFVCEVRISWIGYRFGKPVTVDESNNLLWVRDRAFQSWLSDCGAVRLSA